MNNNELPEMVGIFAGEPLTETEELDVLADAIYNDRDMWVDGNGVAHLKEGAKEEENGNSITGDVFAGEPLTESEELSDLADALYNGDTMVVDQNGVVHLDDGTQSVSNGTTVSDGTFAGEPLTETEELSDLADALYNGDTMVVDQNGVVHLDDGTQSVSNGTTVSDGTFAGEPLTETEELSDLADALYNGDTMVVDQNGVVHLDDGTQSVSNGTTVSDGTFAAPVIPRNPDQWYNKNPRLFRTEVAVMRQRYPSAGYNFFKQTGNMYWTIKMNVTSTGLSQPWTFVLVYDKDHPNNRHYGGSIKVLPIKPNEADLRRRAKAAGRPGVPHLLHDDSLGTYLCTRRTEDVEDGVLTASTAAQVAAWAADWAIHFEVGLKDKKVWNKWCDDAHFRSLMI